VLIPLGAALEARDRVVDVVGGVRSATRSRRAIDRQLTRFERRGGKARSDLERQARHHRTRLEGRARDARRGFDVDALQSRVAPVRNRARRLVAEAQDRINRAA
jgi:hypothetical protein